MKVYDFQNRLPWALSDYGSGLIEGELNMSDKIVIYFDMDKYDAVIKSMQMQYERLYEPHQLLNPDQPLFSQTLPNERMALNNSHFRFLYGISFAEDPVEIEGEQKRSRNQTIAEVLRRATKQVGIQNIETPEFDEAIRKQFEYFKIDPDNPAFNIHEKGEENGRIQADPILIREHEKRWKDARSNAN